MKFAFVGTVKGSLVGLEALIGAGAAPELCITLPESAAHRHSDFADIRPAAASCGARVVETKDINSDEVLDALRESAVDVTLVVGWSQICREPFRTATPMGAVGYHPSPLPRFRGRAVIPWTILAGEVETASSLFWLDEGMDSGPILLQRAFKIDPDETATTLYAKHNRALADMLPEAVRRLGRGDTTGRPQDESRASYCAKRTADDGLIDWSLPAEDVLRLVRAVAAPYPGAFTYHEGDRIIIDEARIFPNPERYLGLPGQVQAYVDDGFLVRCGDGQCLYVTSFRSDANVPPKLHRKLNGHCR